MRIHHGCNHLLFVLRYSYGQAEVPQEYSYDRLTRRNYRISHQKSIKAVRGGACPGLDRGACQDLWGHPWAVR